MTLIPHSGAGREGRRMGAGEAGGGDLGVPGVEVVWGVWWCGVCGAVRGQKLFVGSARQMVRVPVGQGLLWVLCLSNVQTQ